MKYVFISTLLIQFVGHFSVQCSFLHNVTNYWTDQKTSTAQNNSLIIAVDTSGQCFVLNAQFVTNKMNSLYQEFLFACPTDSDENEQLSEEQSKTIPELSIKHVYVNPNKRNSSQKSGVKDEIIEHKCEKPIRPSIINIGTRRLKNPEIQLYLVGYKIDLGNRKKSCSVKDYEVAGIIGEEFTWFNLYAIAFNPEKRDVISVFSSTLSYNSNSGELSDDDDPDFALQKIREDYSLGEDIFYKKDFHIELLYGQVNQDVVFSTLFAEEYKKMDFQYFDWDQGRSLQKVHLAPLDSFGIPLLRLAGQTFGNVAPMWSLVYKHSWFNIETHIKHLARGMRMVNKITGTYGTLKLSGKEIYIGPDDNTVKVPAAFWKIVSYSPAQNVYYNIVIVTNNNPYENTDDFICKVDQCEEFGWEFIQESTISNGRTTCCKLTKEILDDLQMKRCVEEGGVLNLNEVPHWKDDKITLNVKNYIEDRINGKNTDKKVDDIIYRNNDILPDNNEEDEEITLRKLMSLMYENYALPLWSSMFSRSFGAPQNSDDVIEKTLVSS